MTVELVRTSGRFVAGVSGNPRGRVKGEPNKKDRQVDYCSTEKCANRLADRLREYWFLRHVFVKVWAEPVFAPRTNGEADRVVSCYAVRSNIGQVMSRRK